jgi:multidrug efflux pump subunit AcrA (membrane-fusion protein)
MHPQIHMDHSGECPICHMNLIKVTKKIESSSDNNADRSKRTEVQFNAQQASLLGIQKYKVEKMTLTATIPVSGRVVSSSAVALQIYEDDLHYIHSGQAFQGEIGSYSDDKILGTISSVDSIADPTSRTVRVVGAIKNAPRGLISESSFRGEIEIQLNDRIAIPESSVLHTGNSDLVYIFISTTQNTVQPKSVQLGIKAEGFYEVISGLNVGDFISSGPNFLIDSEAKIRGTSD